jgi:endonuclease YncB( thermonuclease family)
MILAILTTAFSANRFLTCFSRRNAVTKHMSTPPPPPPSPSNQPPLKIAEKLTLDTVEYKDTLPFYHDITYCKCVKVYDGDTITIATTFNDGITWNRFAVRIMGIDSPEMKGGSDTEKIYATKSRDELRNKILGKIIRLDIVKTPEKWGRILANVYLDDINIGQWMLDNGLAIPYNGKTKQPHPFNDVQ